jgi:PelA/Pel-15E family pectate lyase
MNRFTIIIFLTACAVSAYAGPVTFDRIQALPPAEQVAWKNYLERSQSNAVADAAAVQAEVTALKRTNAIKAPSGGDYKLKVKPGDAWFASSEAKLLADAVLSYQTTSGGWSKHLGFTKGPRQPGMQWTSQNEPGQPAHYVATFDNGSTTEEIRLLAGVWLATKREDCKAAVIKGLKYILAAQFPNGGWPQVYPLEGGYHDDITFNDDAMTHVLELLQAIANREPAYTMFSDAERQQAEAALALGIQCVLKMQVVQEGKRTVWCAQNDALTLQPANARKMEPATLSGLESAHILKFLMTIPRPSAELVTAITNGLQWLDAVKITGETKTNAAGKKYFEPDSKGTQIRWARFYNLTNNQPVFPGRDGIIYNSFAEMAAHNKLGYDYFSSQPGSIVNNGQKKWRKMLAGKK